MALDFNLSTPLCFRQGGTPREGGREGYPRKETASCVHKIFLIFWWLAYSANVRASNICFLLLSLSNEHCVNTLYDADALRGHVMISYQWDVQERMKKLKHELELVGFDVWMDVEQMGK